MIWAFTFRLFYHLIMHADGTSIQWYAKVPKVFAEV